MRSLRSLQYAPALCDPTPFGDDFPFPVLAQEPKEAAVTVERTANDARRHFDFVGPGDLDGQNRFHRSRSNEPHDLFTVAITQSFLDGDGRKNRPLELC